VGGSARLDGTDLLALPEVRMRDVRGGRVAMIFQEPATSLNPVLTVGRQIVEVLERHVGLRGAAARARALSLLDAVGIADGARRLDEYPFQLSGGMKQRVMIALALAAEPELLIADEPTTALDVTIQAQVLEVLRAAQAETDAALLLITHDLGIVAGIADRVVVMYAGRIVEEGTLDDIFYRSRHPYTLGLLGSLPRLDSDRRVPLATIPGTPPSLLRLPDACALAPRCAYVQDQCRAERPELETVDDSAEHRSACFRAGELPALAAAPVRGSTG
jgi:oligopeptide/dipeptide ABC transporter ATP-binding protein